MVSLDFLNDAKKLERMENGLALKPADFVKVITKERKLRPFSSYKNLRELLVKCGIDSDRCLNYKPT
jgi:hypothetical protein